MDSNFMVTKRTNEKLFKPFSGEGPGWDGMLIEKFR